jgi:zinc transport system substrate-binding protein
MKRCGAAVLLVIAGLCSICGVCGLPPSARAQAPMQVTVSILPQKYFVEKIGGRLVDAEVMVQPGSTPERYEPRPRQMVALSRSKIYFACGVPFEAVWLQKMAEENRSMLVVHTEEWIGKRQIEGHHHEEEGGAVHSHGEEDTSDPHIWLSPPLVMIQARHIAAALITADPANRDAYEKNYQAFLSELAGLDLAISKLFAGKQKAESRSFMVFHPAWGYFADTYGLKQVPVEIEGKEPRAKDLERFITLAKELKVKTIFIQPQYSDKSARVVADAIGGQLVFADDLAPDWAANLMETAGRIAEGGERRTEDGGRKAEAKDRKAEKTQ